MSLGRLRPIGLEVAESEADGVDPDRGAFVPIANRSQNPDGLIPTPANLTHPDGTRTLEVGVGGIILAGGRGTRMGSPKAGLRFGPERLIDRVVGRLSGTAKPIVVVLARDQSLDLPPGEIILVRDQVEDEGPLRGLATGLPSVGDVEFVYVTGTDVPFLAPGWITRLVESIGPADIALPVAQGRPQPLAALYRRSSVIPAIASLLDRGCRRLLDLRDLVTTREVDAEEFRDVDPDLLTLMNLNTPAEYRDALVRAGFDPPSGLAG